MATRVRQPDGTAPFVSDLLSILAEGPSDLVSWSSNGQAFIIWDAERFSEEILQYRSKSSNFASFVRQLNFYGFRKVNKTTKGHDPRVWEFQHFLFVRDRQDLICQIKRRTAQDNTSKNDNDMLRTELGGVRSLNTALREAVIKMYRAIVETSGEEAIDKLDLNEAALEVIMQHQAMTTARKTRKPRLSGRAAKLEVPTYESGRKRARTESTSEFRETRTRAAAAQAAVALQEKEEEEEEDNSDVDDEDTVEQSGGEDFEGIHEDAYDAGRSDTDVASESEAIPNSTTFEFGELHAAMPNLSASAVAASDTQQTPSQGLLSPIHSALVRAESTGNAGFGDDTMVSAPDVKPPWLSRMPSFNGLVSENSTMTPTFGFGINDQSFSAPPAPVERVDEFFAVQNDAEAPSAGLPDRFMWETELDSPSVSSLRPFLPVSASATPTASTSDANRHAGVGANRNATTTENIQLLSDAQKQEVVSAMTKMLFDQNAGIVTGVANIQRLVKSPAVQKALAANSVSVDETDPVTSLKQFIHMVRPDVVLSCLVPLIPQIQQLVRQITTQITYASLSMASTLARSTNGTFINTAAAAASSDVKLA